jgi:hypothetical protein
MFELEKVIKGVGSIFALLPGVAILVDKIQMPPDLRAVFGGAILSVGFVIVGFAIFAGTKLEKMRASIVVLICAACLVIFVTSFLTYNSLYGMLVVKFDFVSASSGGSKEEQIVVPLRPSGDLKRMLDDYVGNWRQLLVTFPALRDEVKRQNCSAEALLFSLLLICISSLVFAMVLIAWRLAPIFRAKQQRV